MRWLPPGPAYAGSKTLHQQNPPVLYCRCRLTQVDVYNGRKMVVVVVVVVKLILTDHWSRLRLHFQSKPSFADCVSVLLTQLFWRKRWRQMAEIFMHEPHDLHVNRQKNGPVSVCPSVRHKSVFYRNGWTNWAGFWHVSFLPPVLHCVKSKFGYLQNKGTSLWNFVLNSGVKKFRHGISIVETCYQLDRYFINHNNTQ